MSAEQFSKMATALLGPTAAGIDLTNHQQLLDFAESLVAGNTSDSSAGTPTAPPAPVMGGRGRGRGRGRGGGRGRGRAEVPVPSDSSDVDAAAEVLSEKAVTNVFHSLGMTPTHNSDEEDSDIQEMCAEAQAVVAGDESPTE